MDHAERALFVLARARLRQRLAAQLGVEPGALRLARTEHGKLSLEGVRDAPCFSVAHAGEYVLIGTADHDLGVDIERLRSVDELGLARLCFAEEEAESLRALDAASRRDAFFRAWTLREALLKAVGHGFSLQDARAVTIDADPDAPRIVRSRAPGVRADDWVLCSLRAPPGYAAAWAVRTGASRTASSSSR